MSFDLYPLFPTVVAKKSIAVDFTKDEVDNLYSTDIFLQNLGNGLSFNEFLLNNPKFKRLKELCLNHAQEYFLVL